MGKEKILVVDDEEDILERVRYNLARIKAFFRRRTRNETADDGVLGIDDMMIHPGRREVKIGDRPVDLTWTTSSSCPPSNAKTN